MAVAKTKEADEIADEHRLAVQPAAQPGPVGEFSEEQEFTARGKCC